MERNGWSQSSGIGGHFERNTQRVRLNQINIELESGSLEKNQHADISNNITLQESKIIPAKIKSLHTSEEHIGLKKGLNQLTENSDHNKDSLKSKELELKTAFQTLDKKEAVKKYPELSELYSLTEKATKYAEISIGNEDSRNDFVQKIQERSFSELAKGNPLPNSSINQDSEIKHSKNSETELEQ